MSQPQNTLAVIFAPLAVAFPHVVDAVEQSGWACRLPMDLNEDLEKDVGMILIDGREPMPDLHGRPVVVAIAANGVSPVFPADVVIDPAHDVAGIVAQLAPWRIPGVDALARMADMFGRDGLLPVVEGLRVELERALSGPDHADPHRIAGLSGTLGFGAASASWQAVDRGEGEWDAALRDSRTVLIAIDGWMRRS
ncbi:hypothetical protein [Sphingobium sp.]|uniref:hypothetical protein n=1 Tax=Sphingobium sp. TaxID=1912891 RepID=UPI003B3ACA3E